MHRYAYLYKTHAQRLKKSSRMEYGTIAPSQSPRRRSLRDRIRSFRPLVQVVAFLSLFLLCILNSFIVPIVPDYLRIKSTEIRLGALLAANSFVTIVVNPVAAYVTDRYGYQIPVVGGLLIYATASFVSAFAKQIASNDLTKTYIVLFVTRAIQGVGDAFSVVASLSMIAVWYTRPDERAKAMGNAFAAAGIGLVIGYPFGGAFSAVPGEIDAGWKWPFITTGLLSLTTAFIALLMGSSPRGRREREVNHLDRRCFVYYAIPMYSSASCRSYRPIRRWRSPSPCCPCG